MVELPIVRALVVARIREIAWSPVRQLLFIATLTFLLLVMAFATGLTPIRLTVADVVFRVAAFQLGTLLGISASPMGRDPLDIRFHGAKQPTPGHVMAQLPGSALDRLAATTLLAMPMALPYALGMLLSPLLPHNSARSVAVHISLLVFGFGAQRAWKQVPGDRIRRWMRRPRWSLPIYAPLDGGEISAAFWAVAAQSMLALVYAPAMVLLVGCSLPHMLSELGVERVALSLAALASYSALTAIVMHAVLLLPALAATPVSKRSLAAAVLLLVLLLTALAGVSVLAIFVLYYSSTDGVGAAAQLLITLTGFAALAGAATARFATPKNVAPVAILIALPLMPAMMATGFVAALIPFLMPAMSVLAAVAFALALLLVFTAPRAPLSREPAGLVGAALRLMGAA